MAFYCRILGDRYKHNSPDKWQGPYMVPSAEAAAGVWIKKEWDCRAEESVIVEVKDDYDRQYIVRYKATVNLTLEGRTGPMEGSQSQGTEAAA
jgi:hypothetical protein